MAVPAGKRTEPRDFCTVGLSKEPYPTPSIRTTRQVMNTLSRSKRRWADARRTIVARLGITLGLCALACLMPRSFAAGMSARVLDRVAYEVAVEQPGDKPAEEPKEPPGDKPAKAPAEEPKEQPGDKPAKVPAEKPKEQPGGKPAKVPAEKPKEQPSDKPAKPPAEKPKEQPGGKPAAEATTKIEPCSVAPPETRKAAARAIREGEKYLRRRQFRKAEDKFVAAVELDPASLYARHRLADALVGEGKLAQAAAIYDRIVGDKAQYPEDAIAQESAARARSLVGQLEGSERGGLLEMTAAEQQAFRDQAEREAEINRDEEEFGEALRAAGLAEWLGRGIGAPLPGRVYSDILKAGLAKRLEEKNLPAAAGLLDVAYHLSIHSAECAALERDFIRISRGEAEKVALQAAPLIAALDDEVTARRAEEEIRDRERRRRRIAKLTAAATALVEGLTGYERYRAILGAQTPVMVAEAGGTKQYVHHCPRRLDYGLIVELKEADRIQYALQPLLFKLTPSEWQARAIIMGYEKHEPKLPAQDKKGMFIVGLERDASDMRHYYFVTTDASDPKMEVKGRFGTRGAAEKAMEFFYVSDPKYTPGTIHHD